MRTKKDRTVYDNIDIILVFSLPYIIALADIISFFYQKYNETSRIPMILAFICYSSILLNLLLLNSSKRNKMCVCHRNLIISNLFVVLLVAFDELIYKFSQIGLDILSLMCCFQIMCFGVAGILNWKYGIFERETTNSRQSG